MHINLLMNSHEQIIKKLNLSIGTLETESVATNFVRANMTASALVSSTYSVSPPSSSSASSTVNQRFKEQQFT